MRLVFDLDETLVATRVANREAYREIGVESPPISDHEPVTSWPTPPTAAQRAAKHQVFERHLRRLGRLLPAHRLLGAGGGVAILTGTSTESVQIICRLFPALAHFPVLTGMTPEDKLRWLRGQPKTGVYFDDWSVMVQRVREETRWQAIDVTGF